MSTPSLKLTNTLTRQKEDFVPIDPANVRMYVCGPTVYDFAHIGNARPVIVFDLLYRLLRHLYPGAGSAADGSRVTYVRNITDVDDKINARALRDFPDLPLNDAIRRVTETTATQFATDVAALGCLPPSAEPRATEHISGMITIIERLIAKGHAYQAGGEVLFRVSSMDDYGQLSGRNLEDNIAGARVAVESHKENPADFVLWKSSSAEEPGWDSPWGRGRPGWHIECSAMSEALLGETFDIHGGGLDLIFPHHENEIAQSRCAHGTDVMANYWMHNGYLQVEGRKMSKSEGNFVTIHDLLETEKFGGRKWPGEVLRLAMLMTHYREPIDFSVARLEEAFELLKRWRRAAMLTERSSLNDDFMSALASDLDSQRALAEVSKWWRRTPTQLFAGDVLHAKKFLAREATTAQRVEWTRGALEMLGLDGCLREDWLVDLPNSAGLESRIDARLAALAARDFATADAIRTELADQGIALLDYKDPESGEKRTKWEAKR